MCDPRSLQNGSAGLEVECQIHKPDMGSWCEFTNFPSVYNTLVSKSPTTFKLERLSTLKCLKVSRRSHERRFLPTWTALNKKMLSDKKLGKICMCALCPFRKPQPHPREALYRPEALLYSEKHLRIRDRKIEKICGLVFRWTAISI